MKQIGFLGPSYTLSSVNADCQATRNWYLEINELGTGKNQEIARLVRTPGTTLFATVGNGPLRGMYRAGNGRVFVVSGSILYELNSNGTSTVRGNLGTVKQHVTMADNGLELALADQTGGHLLKFADNTFSEIMMGDGFTGYKKVVFQDGYFLVNKPNTKEFYISDLYNGASWSSLDFASKEGAPDNLLTIESSGQQIWLLGEKTSEVWFNSGAADFPFERVPGAVLDYGIEAVESLQKIDGGIAFLSRDDKGGRIVVKVIGQQAQRISTHAIEYELNQLSDCSGATAYTYQSNGHNFYALNVPGLGTTYVHDSATGFWHERTYTSPTGRGISRHRADFHVYAWGKHLVGDYENGNIYEFSDDVYTDNGDPITLVRRAPHLSDEGRYTFYSRLRVDAETGVGIDGSGQGVDPKMMLRYSDDGGHTWSEERVTSLGRIGQYRARCEWRRLGKSRDRVWEIKVTDPVKCTILGAFIEGQGGSN